MLCAPCCTRQARQGNLASQNPRSPSKLKFILVHVPMVGPSAFPISIISPALREGQCLFVTSRKSRLHCLYSSKERVPAHPPEFHYLQRDPRNPLHYLAYKYIFLAFAMQMLLVFHTRPAPTVAPSVPTKCQKAFTNDPHRSRR
jgi:hypothetical protein